MICNRFVCLTIHVLYSAEVLSEESFDFGKTVENRLKFVSFESYDSANCVDFETLNIEFCDDSESTLPSNEQLFQIITSVVFHYLRAEVQNLSIRSHCLESKDVRTERTVFDDVLPTCVCCCVAPHLTGTLGSQVQRSFKTLLLQELVKFLQNDSCFDRDYRADRVKFFDFIHVFEVHNDFVKDRNAASDEPSISSLRYDSEFPLVTVLEYFWNLFCVLW